MSRMKDNLTKNNGKVLPDDKIRIDEDTLFWLQQDILEILNQQEKFSLTFKPEEHPMGFLHLLWGTRDYINEYFNSIENKDESEKE